ncbi:hypothetical protein LSH36_1383g00023 [Paralvinella palmiformis]|uniref:Carbohydrate sulfotransferase n=1 Tax=Paralvinella palmiformis TaxID=53620 RepID=A0AAD9ISU7_9ANNE|nr:hypothetical protein LSH36_1383g00023 [Paralvinella palmiformis]
MVSYSVKILCTAFFLTTMGLYLWQFARLKRVHWPVTSILLAKKKIDSLEGNPARSRYEKATSVGSTNCSQQTRIESIRNQCLKSGLIKNELRVEHEITTKKTSTLPIIIDDGHRVLFCPVLKAASTAFIKLLTGMTGIHQQTDTVHNPRYIHAVGLKYLSDFNASGIRMRLKNYFKFMVVRHPFDRLRSAYVDKFTGPGPAHNYFPKYVDLIEKCFRGNLSIDVGGQPMISFEQFLILIAKQQRRFVNAHWLDYVNSCQPCLIQYDHVIKMESFGEDLKVVLDHLNQTTNKSLVLPKHGIHRSTSFDERFREVITQPTRSDANEQHILDLMITDSPGLLSHVSVTPLIANLDHFDISRSLAFDVINNKNYFRKIWDYEEDPYPVDARLIALEMGAIMLYVEESGCLGGDINHVFKLTDLKSLYKEHLQKLGGNPRKEIHSTRLAQILLQHIPSLDDHDNKSGIILSFKKDLSDVLLDARHSDTYNAAVMLMRVANLLCKDLFQKKPYYDGSLREDQYDDLCTSLPNIVKMILVGVHGEITTYDNEIIIFIQTNVYPIY